MQYSIDVYYVHSGETKILIYDLYEQLCIVIYGWVVCHNVERNTREIHMVPEYDRSKQSNAGKTDWYVMYICQKLLHRSIIINIYFNKCQD